MEQLKKSIIIEYLINEIDNCEPKEEVYKSYCSDLYKISNLDIFITGDSGPMHLAASFQVPTVAIFGPTRDDETSQWMNEKSRIVKKNLDCQPCMKRTCPLTHHNCMKLIEAKEIIDSIPIVEKS